MKRIISTGRWAAIAALLTLAACGRGNGDAKDTKGAPGAPPPTVEARLLTVEPRSVPVDFEVIGRTEGARQVEVRARVSGILEKRLYAEGTFVREGAPLFQLDRTPFEIALAQSKAQLAQAQSRVTQLKREVERLEPLAREKAVSRKEYDDTVSSLQSAVASVQESEARVRDAERNLSYTLVTAPIAGISGRAPRSEGSLITTDAAGGLLTTINQIEPLWVRFSLSESDLARLPGRRLPQAAASRVQLVLPDGSVYPGKGRINFAATEIDTTLGSQQLRAEFDNPKGDVLPGQFVRVRLTAGEQQNVFLVPQRAITQTEKAYLVFVVDGEGKAQLRPVQVGAWVGTDWIVMGGLKSGEKVVIDNLMKVRPGTQIKPPAPAAKPGAEPPAAAPAAAPAK